MNIMARTQHRLLLRRRTYHKLTGFCMCMHACNECVGIVTIKPARHPGSACAGGSGVHGSSQQDRPRLCAASAVLAEFALFAV